MLNQITKERIYCGLDIGSQRVKAGLIKTKEFNDLEILGVYELPTAGFKQSSVQDLGELSECVFRTIAGLSRKTGVKIETLHLGIGGDLVECRQSHTVIPLVDRGNKVIIGGDIKKINRQARLLGVKMEEEILHDFPQCYKVDDVNTALNPLGLYGRKLEVELLLILSDINRVKNITKAVNQAGFEVAHIFFSGFASASLVLNSKMQNDGCILVDLGADTGHVLIFKDGLLKYLSRLSWGGDRITRAIARHLNLSFDLAEEIKKSYAVATGADQDPDEEILVKGEVGYLPIKRDMIFQAIDPEIKELVDQLSRSIQASGFGEQINAGIVMTGGTSLLTGLIERLEDDLHLPVCMGKVSVATRSVNAGPLFASAVGLAQEGFCQDYKEKFSLNGRDGKIKSLMEKVQGLYQEYF